MTRIAITAEDEKRKRKFLKNSDTTTPQMSVFNGGSKSKFRALALLKRQFIDGIVITILNWVLYQYVTLN